MHGTAAHAQGSPVVWRALARHKERRRRQKERTELTLNTAKFTLSGSIAGATMHGLSDGTTGGARRRGATTAKLPSDLLGHIFCYLVQERLAVCYRVCRQWCHVIEHDSHLNIVLKVQILEDQCYDEVYNCDSLDLYGHDVDFCFTDPPPASMLTAEGWQETHCDDTKGALKKASYSSSLRYSGRRRPGGGKPKMVAVPASHSRSNSSVNSTSLPSISTSSRSCVTGVQPAVASSSSSSSSSSVPAHVPNPPSIEVRGSKLGGSQKG